MATKTNPSTVSRTLDAAGRSLASVIGQHDRRISDADINLIQDIQDLKRLRILDHQAPSGCLSLSPFTFNTYVENCFYVPKFNVLFRGEVLSIQGNQSENLEVNRVLLPPAKTWSNGMLGDDAVLYAVFLEVWGKALSPVDGSGYYVDASGNRFYYPYGAADPAQANRTLFPDDTIDPFDQIMTTLRLQIQWRIRVEPIPLAYNFEKNRFGLDQDPTCGSVVYGRGAIPSADPVSGHAFKALAGVTGEPCLWRAGDGSAISSLGTIDGYTYALPLAVVFQRNRGIYHMETNPFGCAPTGNASAGSFASALSGRLDGRFYDIVYPDDVVDTRTSVSLTGYNLDSMADQGVTDLFTGAIQSKIARGEAPGAKATALGSKLTYTLELSTRTAVNVDVVGAPDGWANGFSSDSRTFYTQKVYNLQDRSKVGTRPGQATQNNQAWGYGDEVTISLGTQVVQGAVISSVLVQSFVPGTSTPLALYGGQMQVDRLNSRSVTIRITSDLAKLALSPGSSPLVVTFGITYPSGTGADTQRIPMSLAGGVMHDSETGKALQVYGVSEYDALSNLDARTTSAKGLTVYSPLYSPSTFGVRVNVQVANSTAQITTGTQGSQLNTFVIPRKGLDGTLTGLYAVSARDRKGKSLVITRRYITGDTLVVTVDGQLSSTSSTEFTILCHQLAVVALNPPVRGVTALEETVLVGNVGDNDLSRDPRVTVASVTYSGSDTKILLYSRDGVIHGLAGDDTGKALIWGYDEAKASYKALQATVSVQTGIVVITLPAVNLEGTTWFAVAALRPAIQRSSQVTLSISYQPYQGEGVEGRDYTVLYAPENALVTTNGTGAAPIAGLQDVFPFNRQLPIATAVPALSTWPDSDLKNQALTTEMGGNFIAKRFVNVEHTLSARLHTNDFIAPLHGTIRKKLRMASKSGRRGFSKALPHVGFAIEKPTPRSVLGGNLQATIGAVTLYVHNQDGNNGNDGLTKSTAKKTVRGALEALPPVLRHPVSIVLLDTGAAYTIKDLQKTDFTQALLGDGETRSLRYYSLGKLAFVMQESARITIGRESTTGERIVVDASGFSGFGDGPTFAFLVEDSRVIFHGISFRGFTSSAVKVIDSDVEFLDCEFDGNLIGCSAEQGSFITFSRGVIRLGSEGFGCIVASSQVLVDSVQLKVVSGASPSAFFVAELSSSMTFQHHNANVDTTLESGVASSTLIGSAQTGSTLVCDPSWVSNGKCKIRTNSTLVRSLAVDPFKGGVDKDTSSSDVPTL